MPVDAAAGRVTGMFLKSKLLSAVVGLTVAGMVTAAQGAVLRLDYDGNDFSTAISPYTTGMSIVGWVILDEALTPSADNLFAKQPGSSLTDKDVNSFSIFDGVNNVTKDDASNYGFLFNTDSEGNLIGWRADVQYFVGATLFTTIICNNPSGPTSTGACGDDDVAGSDGDRAGLGSTGSSANNTNPGEWTVTAVPIPAALPLFATGLGLMGLLGWRRKRKGLSQNA